MAMLRHKDKGKRKVADEGRIENEAEKEAIEKTVKEYRKRKKAIIEPIEKPKIKRLKPNTDEPLSECEERLLYVIIADCCESYRNAYIRGKERDLLACKSFLQSGRVELYTQYKYEGQGLIDTMNKDLMKKYGAFKKGHRLKRKKRG